MTDRTIIILHAPEDAQDAFMIARELVTPPRPFRDPQVRLLTAAEHCRLPLGFESARLIFVSSITSVNSLAISRVLDAYLKQGHREDVLVVAASSVLAGYGEEALISPILRYRRSAASGLLEDSGFSNTLIGDMRSETAEGIAGKIESHIRNTRGGDDVANDRSLPRRRI
ncbi:hypothetical protein V0U79_10480 [Hyphobacterium sp. HN65]|uniref:Uncharacterized protein n=1 Tax=Hyphobacterium lacteum TaxID=3116575 RepID=A0ABU7LS99_9PROT|nr:hypothetical protein [Hyphobacterium sp. HN65]MEE2526797.1 hypothetical protein [Hyphobacterium sp. HN65]